MPTGHPPRSVVVTSPAMEYIVRITTLVPIDRNDLCTEIVANVYGPVTASVVSYKPLDE